MRLFWRC